MLQRQQTQKMMKMCFLHPQASLSSLCCCRYTSGTRGTHSPMIVGKTNTPPTTQAGNSPKLPSISGCLTLFCKSHHIPICLANKIKFEWLNPPFVQVHSLIRAAKHPQVGSWTPYFCWNPINVAETGMGQNRGTLLFTTKSLVVLDVHPFKNYGKTKGVWSIPKSQHYK